MERLLLVLGLLLLLALLVYGLYAGWRHRAARQSGLAELPALPTDLGPDVVAPMIGVYVSTTTAGNWQARFGAGGLGRAAAGAPRLGAEGVCIERNGESDIFIPVSDVVEVTTAPGIAGKVIGRADGIVIVRWRLGGVALDSGFRSDDPDRQLDWIDAAHALLAAGPVDGGVEPEHDATPNINGAPS
jgi:hypothetical protein